MYNPKRKTNATYDLGHFDGRCFSAVQWSSEGMEYYDIDTEAMARIPRGANRFHYVAGFRDGFAEAFAARRRFGS